MDNIQPRRRGRPPLFYDAKRAELAGLIRRYGVRQARAASPVPISVQTLLKIARERGIQLRRGRRPGATAGWN